MASSFDFKNDFFDNLEELGFDNLNDLSIYDEDKQLDHEHKESRKERLPAECIYEKKLQCPVCSKEISIPAVKLSSIRVISRDTDFMTYYQEPSPMYYDAWLCKHCGYAAFSNRFSIIGEKQIKLIKIGIGSKWKPSKQYPNLYDIDIAIELHQLVLLNTVVRKARDSEKAICCLKLAWLYRIKKDTTNEKKFIFQALQGFIKAIEYEKAPIAGMDDPSLEYLIGELYRRLDDSQNALIWFSRVLGGKHAKTKIKNLARDQKDIIRELQSDTSSEEAFEYNKKKKTIFGNLFGINHKS